MSLEGSEAPRAARVSFLAWIFAFRGRPTGGYPRLRAALVFLLRIFWFWIVGARRFLLCRPTGAGGGGNGAGVGGECPFPDRHRGHADPPQWPPVSIEHGAGAGQR